jgi:hypothetical protein
VGGPTRRESGRRAIVFGVPTGEPLQVRIDVDREIVPISGEVRLDGVATRPFAGWTELFVALEAAITDARTAVRDPVRNEENRRAVNKPRR